MPQLHHHTFITNMTQRPDGQWRGLEPDQMFKARGFIDSVYMTELAKNVQQLGYSIVRGSDGAFELAGFTRKQIEAFSERFLDIAQDKLKQGIGATDLDHVQARMADLQRNGSLIAAGKSYLHPLDKYTTLEMALLERENRSLVRDWMNHGRPIAGIAIRSAVDGTVSSTGGQEVRDWASARKLLPDQTDAALLTLTTPKWASAIEGLAGTTKTTLVGAVKEFAEEHGWTVRGFGTTTGARS